MRLKQISVILMAAMLAACSSNSSEVLPTEKVTVEKTVNLTGEKNTPQCHVLLELLQVKEDKKQKKDSLSVAQRANMAIMEKVFGWETADVKAAADSFATLYTRDYVKNMAPLYREDRNDEQKHAWYEYRYVVTTEVRAGRQETTCYLISLDYYEGGAHGIQQLLTLNIDNRTGATVTLTDLLVPGYEGRLTELLLTALLEKTGAKGIEALHERGYLYSMDMFASENFIVGTDGLTFVYNPYELAPYSEGRIELTVCYDDMDQILK